MSVDVFAQYWLRQLPHVGQTLIRTPAILQQSARAKAKGRSTCLNTCRRAFATVGEGSSVDGAVTTHPPEQIQETKREKSTRTNLPTSNSIHRPPTKAAAYSALGHRIRGAAELPIELIERCCTHQSFSSSEKHANNLELETIGNELLGLLAAEFVESRWPNLPNAVMRSALSAYAGTATCAEIARYWGLFSGTALTASPDPLSRRANLPKGKSLRGVGEGRRAGSALLKWSRQTKPGTTHNSQAYEQAMASMPRALVGAILQEHGFEKARQFVTDHFLTRQINVASLLYFPHPKQILQSTLRKYEQEPAVSRLISEAGRHSVSPVFVVGVYTAQDRKLGEALGSSLKMAEHRACEDALRRIYLSRTAFSTESSPLTNSIRQLPSDTLANPSSVYSPTLDLIIGDDETQPNSGRGSKTRQSAKAPLKMPLNLSKSAMTVR